jgi:hypothetical protein
VDDRPQLPQFGVPDRIAGSEIPFVVTAGVGLSIVLMVAAGVLLQDLGTEEMDPDNSVHRWIVLSTLAGGPAAAYYLGRRLQSVGVSRAYGCAGLTIWTVALFLMSAIGGWLGAGLALTLATVWFARFRPRRSRS